MKTISINEFESLLARNDWQREQDYEVVECLNRRVEKWNEKNESPELSDIPHVWGWASKISSLEGVKITYNEGFSYDECDSDSLSTGTEGLDDVWSVEGVTVVDDDGDELSAHTMASYLNSDFSGIDYSVLEIDQVTDIDVDEDADMKTFTVKIDKAPSIRFTGKLTASAASSDNKAMGSSYSGHAGRWTELELYESKGGKFVCHQVARTLWQGERDRFSGKVCETLEEVKDFFGHCWLASELYAKAGIALEENISDCC